MSGIEPSFGKLFYHDDYTQYAELLCLAISEVAAEVGHSLENPISISLLCLETMIPSRVCWLIYLDIFKIINEDDSKGLESLNQVKAIIVKHFPDAKNFSNLFVMAFMKAMAKCMLPELLPHIKKLSI